jgi:hypothetical protein
VLIKRLLQGDFKYAEIAGNWVLFGNILEIEAYYGVSFSYYGEL